MKRYDCTDGGAQFCQGCYTMAEDSLGDYVKYEDHAAEVERLTQTREADMEVYHQVYMVLLNAGDDKYLGALEQAQALVAKVERLRGLLAIERGCDECWKGTSCGAHCHMNDAALGTAVQPTAAPKCPECGETMKETRGGPGMWECVHIGYVSGSTDNSADQPTTARLCTHPPGCTYCNWCGWRAADNPSTNSPEISSGLVVADDEKAAPRLPPSAASSPYR